MANPGLDSVEYSVYPNSDAELRHRFDFHVEHRCRDSVGKGNTTLADIKMEIESRISDPDFSLAVVSSALNVSTRQIQRAMAGIGTTFSAYVRNKRLSMTMAQLRKPEMRSHSIESISLACGFSDLSAFYRAFKARYGCTPGDVRNELGILIDRNVTSQPAMGAFQIR